MDLSQSGKLLYELRKAKKMTQKQVADKLGVMPKTVSKWETGHGFPDIAFISMLSDIFGVSERTLLSGNLDKNIDETGNMKKIKFYVCPNCGSILFGTGECRIVCCGKQLKPLIPSICNDGHKITVSEIENDFYIEFEHEMSKEHFISFAAYVTHDKILTAKLYPEQDSSVRFPKMYGGKFYFYCNRHGLFEYSQGENNLKSKSSGLTSLMSAFSRAYYTEHSNKPIFADSAARKLFSESEYKQIEKYISDSNDTKKYVYTHLAPTPLGRTIFCEECINTAIQTGTEQYVILGAGIDTFLIRNKNNNINIFEVDKEPSVKDKMRRLVRAGIKLSDNVKLICADLSKDNLKNVLEENGFDSRKKTIFSCLGLLCYLSNDEISQLFKSISEIASDGSSVVFDFADNHLFSSTVPRAKNMLTMAEKSGEPMKSCFGYAELEKMMDKHNFLIYEFLNRDEINSRYFSDCQNEMTAFEHINYALAVLKRGCLKSRKITKRISD